MKIVDENAALGPQRLGLRSNLDARLPGQSDPRGQASAPGELPMRAIQRGGIDRQHPSACIANTGVDIIVSDSHDARQTTRSRRTELGDEALESAGGDTRPSPPADQ